jgi:hypothetical protein
MCFGFSQPASTQTVDELLLGTTRWAGRDMGLDQRRIETGLLAIGEGTDGLLDLRAVGHRITIDFDLCIGLSLTGP